MFIVSSGSLGGGEATVRLLALHLDKNHFDLTVVCPASPLFRRLGGIPGVKRIAFSFPKIPTLKTVKRLAKLIRRENPQIVHTHLFHGDLYGYFATRLAPVPHLVSTIQGINFLWETEHGARRIRWKAVSGFYRSLYRSFDGLAACSQAVKKAVCSRPGLKIDPAKVRVIHNSVDVAEVRAQVNGSPNGANGPEQKTAARKRIVTVANFVPFKGHSVLLEAIKELQPDLPLECLLVGEGPERKHLEKKSRALGLSEQIRFLGARNDAPALVNGSDLFVFPSLWEPFGIAVLEAMTLGVPVVACSSGGIPEIILNGKNGLLVPPGNPSALAGGIKKILLNPSFGRQLTPAAKQTVQNHFDAKTMAVSYERWYAELIKQKEKRS